MPVLKAPPKVIRNATVQVRVEDEIDFKLRKYAEFIDATPAFVVTESLKMVFNKDAEFREWLTQHADQPTRPLPNEPVLQEPTQVKPSRRTMFEELPPKVANR